MLVSTDVVKWYAETVKRWQRKRPMLYVEKNVLRKLLFPKNILVYVRTYV